MRRTKYSSCAQVFCSILKKMLSTVKAVWVWGMLVFLVLEWGFYSMLGSGWDNRAITKVVQMLSCIMHNTRNWSWQPAFEAVLFYPVKNISLGERLWDALPKQENYNLWLSALEMLHSTQGLAGCLKPQGHSVGLIFPDCLSKYLPPRATPLMPASAFWPLFCKEFWWLCRDGLSNGSECPCVPRRAHGQPGALWSTSGIWCLYVSNSSTGEWTIEPVQFCVSTSLFHFSWLTNQIFHSWAPWEAPSATDIFDSHTALQRTSQGC